VANRIQLSNGNGGTIYMPQLTVGTEIEAGAALTIGSTRITETQLQALLASLPPPP
jgi:hypothetical protein